MHSSNSLSIFNAYALVRIIRFGSRIFRRGKDGIKFRQVFFRLGEQIVRDVDIVAVIGLQQRELDRLVRIFCKEIGKEQTVSERFAHLLSVHFNQPVVRPIFDEGLSRQRLRLRDFVFVVRENQIAGRRREDLSVPRTPRGSWPNIRYASRGGPFPKGNPSRFPRASHSSRARNRKHFSSRRRYRRARRRARRRGSCSTDVRRRGSCPRRNTRRPFSWGMHAPFR